MKILVPLDGAPCSTAAIDAVVAQFHPVGTQVRLLHVVEWPKHLPMHLTAAGPTGADDLLESRNRAFREGYALISQAADRMRAAGFDTTTAVVPGAACDTIVDAASAWQPDLIVMGSRGRKGSGFVLGSVSDAVVHRAPCSVEIVRAPHRVSA